MTEILAHDRDSTDRDSTDRDSTGVDWIDAIYARHTFDGGAAGGADGAGPAAASGRFDYDPSYRKIFHGNRR